jgi:hypothetical protein
MCQGLRDFRNPFSIGDLYRYDFFGPSMDHEKFKQESNDFFTGYVFQNLYSLLFKIFSIDLQQKLKIVGIQSFQPSID